MSPELTQDHDQLVEHEVKISTIEDRLTRIEDKLDRLIWLFATSAVGAVVSALFLLLSKIK